MFTEPTPSLAAVRRDGAEQAGRRFLEALYAEHGDNVSAIARAAKATRLQVKTYMRRYGIGRFAPIVKEAGEKLRGKRRAR